MSPPFPFSPPSALNPRLTTPPLTSYHLLLCSPFPFPPPSILNHPLITPSLSRYHLLLYLPPSPSTLMSPPFHFPPHPPYSFTPSLTRYHLLLYVSPFPFFSFPPSECISIIPLNSHSQHFSSTKYSAKISPLPPSFNFPSSSLLNHFSSPQLSL